MKSHRWYPAAIGLAALVILQGCSQETESVGPGSVSTSPGTVSAFVVDGTLGPVPGVEVTLVPGNLVVKTDQDGLAIFEVPPGEYFVDASVCCIGPGWIEYHLPVEVVSGETVTVRMLACLVCV